MRNFKNLEDLKRVLQIFVNSNNLDLEIINTSTEEIASLEAKINRALVVIGIHGGSLYNTILCKDDCTVIELIPTKNTNSTINFLSYSGIKFIPVPGDFDFYDNTVEVSIPDLSLALSKVVVN
jgi:capsular polysaccharide biosynthesis protein